MAGSCVKTITSPDVGLTVRDTGAANDDQRVGPESDPGTGWNNSYKRDVLR